MSGRIPQSFIDDLLARTDLVELVQSRIELKRAGRNYMACCPFHNEKTPSFSVSPDKQLYHCFGCGESGNAIGFLMAHDRLDFVSAIEELAARAGVDVPRSNEDSGPDLRPLYQVLSDCVALYQKLLRSDQGEPGRNYLQQRGLSDEMIHRFALGFAPSGWHQLTEHLGSSDEMIRKLTLTGMLIQKDDGKTYDRFRERIMFPIRNRRGQVIGFGGRLTAQGEPKYLNSPETPVFSKGREVYGLYEAIQSNRQLEQLIVVEGYMDVVALAQSGITHVVATLGTALTGDHLRLLFRQCRSLVMCFDGDRAGQKAAWRAAELGLAEMKDGREIKFLTLPQGEDPDSWVRKHGSEAFMQAVDKAPPLSEFVLQRLQDQCDLTTVDGKAHLSALAKPLLARITDPVYKRLLAQEIDRRIGTSTSPEPPSRPAASRPMPRRPGTQPARKAVMTPMRKAVAFLLDKPSLGLAAGETPWLEHLKDPGAPILSMLLDSIQKAPPANTGALLERFRDHREFKALTRLAAWASQWPDEVAEQEFVDALAALEKQTLQQRTEELMALARTRQLTPEEKAELKNLLKRSEQA
jgi:DNA primase